MININSLNNNSVNNNFKRQPKTALSFKANPLFEISRKKIDPETYSWVAKKLAKPMSWLINTKFSNYLSAQLGKLQNSISHLSALVSVSISSFYAYGAATNKNLPDERRGYLITNSILGGAVGIALSYLIDFLFKKPLEETEIARKNILKPLMPNLKNGEKLDVNIDLKEFAAKFGIKADNLLDYMGFNVKNYNHADSLTIKEVLHKLGDNSEKDFVNGIKRFAEAQKNGANRFKSLMVFTPIVRFIAPLAAIPLAAVIYNKINPYNGPIEKAPKTPRVSMHDCVQLASKNHANTHA